MGLTDHKNGNHVGGSSQMKKLRWKEWKLKKVRKKDSCVKKMRRKESLMRRQAPLKCR